MKPAGRPRSTIAVGTRSYFVNQVITNQGQDELIELLFKQAGWHFVPPDQPFTDFEERLLPVDHRPGLRRHAVDPEELVLGAKFEDVDGPVRARIRQRILAFLKDRLVHLAARGESRLATCSSFHNGFVLPSNQISRLSRVLQLPYSVRMKPASEPIDLERSKVFCVLPWTQMTLLTSGEILPCCWMVRRPPMANVKDGTLAELWNCDEFRELRKNMLSGRRSWG